MPRVPASLKAPPPPKPGDLSPLQPLPCPGLPAYHSPVSPQNPIPTEKMTIFENVTRALARQLNPRGDLTPLDSLIDFKRFHPFCLVLRKRKSTLFWGARYVRTDYTLLDVLEAGSSPAGQCGRKAGPQWVGARPWFTRGNPKLPLPGCALVSRSPELSQEAGEEGCPSAWPLSSSLSCRSDRLWEL